MNETGARLAFDTGMTASQRRVLIVEDEQSIRDVLVELFETEGVEVSAAASLDYAKWVLGRRSFDLVVTDIRLGGRRDGGLQVMAAAGMLSPEASVIALTAFPDDDNRMASLRLGATHFLEKPVALERIAELAARAGVPTAFTPGALVAPPT
jgi:two-component system, response regulator, stage 0 sporulation protein F